MYVSFTEVDSARLALAVPFEFIQLAGKAHVQCTSGLRCKFLKYHSTNSLSEFLKNGQLNANMLRCSSARNAT